MLTEFGNSFTFAFSDELRKRWSTRNPAIPTYDNCSDDFCHFCHLNFNINNNFDLPSVMIEKRRKTFLPRFDTVEKKLKLFLLLFICSYHYYGE